MNKPLAEWPELKNMGKDLGEVYFAIYQEVLLLNTRWVEYLTLYGTGNDNIELMNKIAPNLFGIIQKGLEENIILQIVRLMDPPCSMGKENLTIRRFPELIQNGKLKEEVEQLICCAKKATEPCREWRKKWHAHRDKNTVLHPKENPLPRISQQDIRERICDITNILDVIRSHYHGKPISTYLPPEWSEAKPLLAILDKHIKNSRRNPYS